MSALYFHIPFCKRICAYCDFVRTADMRRCGDVLQAMHRELRERCTELEDKRIRTVYFGGGTPSLLPPEELQRLVQTAAGCLDLSQVEECTVEINPDDATDDYLRRLRRVADRLSIGIQSLDDACLRAMNRRHTAAQALKAVERARKAGFDNISVDLIFGMGGFGEERSAEDARRMLSLEPEHVSAYHLTIEPGTAFGRRVARGEMSEVDEERGEREYMALHELFTAAGYEHYEVSNYALPGRRAKHNSSYWDATPYLGIGAGAHSFTGRVRSRASSLVEEYAAGRGRECEVLTRKDMRNEMVMLSLRRAEGLDMRAFAERFGQSGAEALERAALPFVRSGALVQKDCRMVIPPEKFMISDYVASALFEL